MLEKRQLLMVVRLEVEQHDIDDHAVGCEHSMSDPTLRALQHQMSSSGIAVKFATDRSVIGESRPA
jgi:hypothetical protein